MSMSTPLLPIWCKAVQVKLDSERVLMEKAAELSSLAIRFGFKRVMKQHIIDEEHPRLTSLGTVVDDLCNEPAKLNAKKPNGRIDLSKYEDAIFTTSLPTTVQSMHSGFDVTLQARTQPKAILSHDVIMVSMGGRVDSYCSHLARTYYINPTSHQQEVYTVLLTAQAAAARALMPGKAFKDAYEAARSAILASEAHGATLIATLGDTVGWAIGLSMEFGPEYALSATNTRLVEAGMTFAVCVSFKDVAVAPGGSKLHSLMVSDVYMADSLGESTSLTPTNTKTMCKKEWKDVFWEVQEGGGMFKCSLGV